MRIRGAMANETANASEINNAQVVVELVLRLLGVVLQHSLLQRKGLQLLKETEGYLSLYTTELNDDVGIQQMFYHNFLDIISKQFRTSIELSSSNHLILLKNMVCFIIAILYSK